MRRQRAFALAVFLAGLAGVLVGAGLVWWWAARDVGPTNLAAVATGATATAPPCPVSSDSQDAITAAVARVGPAVVKIDTRFRTPKDVAPFQPFPREGEGSGVIIDGPHGYILTNAHVVKNAARVTVQLADGRSFRADRIGSDPLTEVAVIRIRGARQLPSAALGDSDQLRAGAWIIAIGNPFGFENSVTVGVLSAKGRQITGPSGINLQGLMQTDASINPGNSGGALVDLHARVVGIPTAMFEPAQGIGFAIPINTARQVAARLIENGEMPWLGVSHRSLQQSDARELRLHDTRGSLVVQVVPGGPAQKADLRPGDVIVSVDGKPIAGEKDLGLAVRSHDVGHTLTFTVLRRGRKLSIRVKLGAVPENLQVERPEE
jgi:serine protease Do